MYRMILQNEKEFHVEALIDNSGVLEIEFSPGTTYLDVATAYDPSVSESFSLEALRRFNLIDEKGEVVGTHVGYTEVVNISAFNGVVKVNIKRESELKTEVEGLKEVVAVQDELIASLIMEVWQ